MNSFIIRKLGNGFGVFKFSKIDLVDVVFDEKSLLKLLKDNIEDEKPQWPEVGMSYWFVSAPNPFEVSVNQGIISEELMEEIIEFSGENNKYGNIFQTKEQATEMARKLANLFE